MFRRQITPPLTALLILALCGVAIAFFSRSRAEERGISLLEVIHAESPRLEVFPIDVACDFEAWKSNYEARYDLTFERYRPLYNLCQAASRATDGEISEMIDAFPSLAVKEKAMAMLAIFLNEQARRRPSSTFAPIDSDRIPGTYDDLLSEKAWEKRIDVMRGCVDDQTVAFEPLNDEGLEEEWEADLRWNFLRLQAILGRANPLRSDSTFESFLSDSVPNAELQESRLLYMSRTSPVPFLYSLALIETQSAIPDALRQVETRDFWDLDFDSDQTDLISILANPDWSTLKEQGIIKARRISASDAVKEVEFIRAALLTQFSFSRRSGLAPMKNGNSSTRQTLGEIADVLSRLRTPRS